jgi:hypothetical protein
MRLRDRTFLWSVKAGLVGGIVGLLALNHRAGLVAAVGLCTAGAAQLLLLRRAWVWNRSKPQ